MTHLGERVLGHLKFFKHLALLVLTASFAHAADSEPKILVLDPPAVTVPSPDGQGPLTIKTELTVVEITGSDQINPTARFIQESLDSETAPYTLALVAGRGHETSVSEEPVGVEGWRKKLVEWFEPQKVAGQKNKTSGRMIISWSRAIFNGTMVFYTASLNTTLPEAITAGIMAGSISGYLSSHMDQYNAMLARDRAGKFFEKKFGPIETPALRKWRRGIAKTEEIIRWGLIESFYVTAVKTSAVLALGVSKWLGNGSDFSGSHFFVTKMGPLMETIGVAHLTSIPLAILNQGLWETAGNNVIRRNLVEIAKRARVLDLIPMEHRDALTVEVFEEYVLKRVESPELREKLRSELNWQRFILMVKCSIFSVASTAPMLLTLDPNNPLFEWGVGGMALGTLVGVTEYMRQVTFYQRIQEFKRRRQVSLISPGCRQAFFR